MKAHLIFNGLGAGNIGDEAMFAGFLNAVYPQMQMTVEVFDAEAPIIQTLFRDYTYLSYTDNKSCLDAALDADVVLIVGDTPIMEDWGLEWPMGFQSRRIDQIKSHGKTVHALGVGVDHLYSQEGRQLFKNSYSYVSSWTVRSESCREALLDLGVSAEHIRVASDFAWLFQPVLEDRNWAKDFLNRSGIDTNKPVLGINVVNERWPGVTKSKKEIAYALDNISREIGIQILFLCNETREGDYFDREASRQVASLMNAKAIIMNTYFTPSRMTALISFCTLAISQRYHFTALSVLAGTPVLSFARGQKLNSLVREFNETPVGNMDDINGADLYARAMNSLNERGEIRNRQQFVRATLAARAHKNLFFLTNTYRNHSPDVRLAKTSEIELPQYKNFMNTMNSLADQWKLRQFTNWSKVWEYPWLWFSRLSSIDWTNARLLDIGSEISSMPWFLASLGATVSLIETDGQWIPIWENIRSEAGLSVDWNIVAGENLPFADESFDVVTSFSVIEHQQNKELAIAEISRVLKPGGLFALSFDICEPGMGMAFPEWNGRALTMTEFEALIWNHPAFDNNGISPHWNTEDIPEFIKWHLQSAPHHNYVVGAAFLRKR
jgi:polysaccharide pyruvyl transferase WcaK-like protein